MLDICRKKSGCVFQKSFTKDDQNVSNEFNRFLSSVGKCTTKKNSSQENSTSCPNKTLLSWESTYRSVLFHHSGIFSGLIIYMKKFLHSDWLRAVQFFFFKQCRKELIQCKKRKQTKHSDWSMIKETHRWPIKSFVFKSSARPGWRNWWRNFSLIAWYTCVSSVLPFRNFLCIYY